VFEWLQAAGGVSEAEMRRTFNCGLGLVLIVDPHQVPDVLEGLARAEEDAFVVGELAKA
jgi:phosphoribosylaminoimidazole (AIR) synthetase